MLMPLIPELRENVAAVTFDPETEHTVSCDMADVGEDSNEEALLLLENQAKITG